MPVRFLCPHCNQLLAVSSRKAGAQVNCPKCGAAIIVPEAAASEVSVSSMTSPQPIQATPPADSTVPEVIEPTVVTAGGRFEDAEVERALSSLVITESPPSTTAHPAPSVTPRLKGAERQTLLLPRSVIYFQGVLFAIVALLFFLAGLWIGSFANPPTSGNPGIPVPGTVRLDALLQHQVDGATRPDDGAVVLALPARQVTDRIPAAPLKPGGPAIGAGDPIMTQLQFVGGAFGRTDSSGKLQGLVVPQGKHHVLLLSNHGRRSGEPRPQDLATLANYLEGAADLLADRQYRLRTEELTTDTAMHHTFGKP
jgi:phage FluMu protein Com